MSKYLIFIILFFALLITSFSIASASKLILSENVTDEEGVTLPKFYDNVVLHQGNKITTFMGGREVKQTKIDADYPCTLVDMYEIECKPIESSKLITLNQKISIEDKVALLTKGIPVYDSSNYLVVTDGITNETRIEYNKSHLDVSKTNYYKIEPQTAGIVKIGFNSNVFQISNFQYGSCWNCTIDRGVVLAQNHSSINENVVGYWQFTQDANDSSQYGNNGTVQSAIKSYEWYNFTSEGSGILLSKSYSVWNRTALGNFTVSVWVNPRRGQDGQVIDLNFTKISIPGSSGNVVFSLLLANGTSFQNTVYSSIPEKVWSHLIINYNGTHLVSYINGGLSQTLFINNQVNNGSLAIVYNNLFIGVMVNGWQNKFNGSIDEVKIYNISLTNTEITSLYEVGLFKHNTISNFTSGILDAGAKANWKNISGNYSGSSLEGQTNITIQVRTGNFSKPNLSDSSLMSLWSLNQTSLFNDTMMRNNGTCTNCPAPVNGTFEGESAYLFDGIDDEININVSIAPSYKNNVTYSIWINYNQITADSIGLIGGRFNLSSTSGFNFYLNGNSRVFSLEYRNTSGGLSYLTFGSVSLIPKVWTNIFIVTNETAFRIYKDGALLSTQSFPGNMGNYTLTRRIGRFESNAFPFNGSLAYVSVWNKSLSQNEIMSWSQYTGEQLLKEDGISISTTPNNRFLQYVANFYSNNTRFTPELINVTAEYDLVPKVTILSPSNISYNLSNVFLAITSDTLVSWNYSNSTASNITMNGNLTLNTTEGSNWIKVCGTNGTYVNCTETYFTVDTISPNITILTPTNTTYNLSSVVLSVTADATITTWNFSNNTQSNIVFNNNMTLNTTQGSNNLTVCGSDGNYMNCSRLVFTVNAKTPNITILTPSNITYNLTSIPLSVTADESITAWNFSNNTQSNIVFNNNMTLNTTEGSNNYTICGSDGVLMNCSRLVFVVDLTAPTITIQAPSNTTYNLSSIPLSVTANEPIAFWWLENNTQSNIRFNNNMTLNVTEGSNQITIYANDSVNNTGRKGINFTINTKAPNLTILTPANISYNLTSVMLSFTADEGGLTYNYSNASNTNIALTTNITVTTIEGNNILTVCGSDGNYMNCSKVYYTVDTIAPIFTILTPTNKTYTQGIYITSFDWTANERISSIRYDNNTATNFAIGVSNTTMPAANGSNQFVVYANDSANNTVRLGVNFTLIFQAIAPSNASSLRLLSDVIKQNELANIKIGCFDSNNYYCSSSTNCNLTILYPNSSTFVDNKAMTYNPLFFDYVLEKNETNVIGTYPITALCNGTSNVFSTFSFKITRTGFAVEPEYSIAIMIAFLSSLIVFVAFTIIIENYAIKSFFAILSVVILMSGFASLIKLVEGDSAFGIIISNLSSLSRVLMFMLMIIFVSIIVWALKQLADKKHQKQMKEQRLFDEEEDED